MWSIHFIAHFSVNKAWVLVTTGFFTDKLTKPRKIVFKWFKFYKINLSVFHNSHSDTVHTSYSNFENNRRGFCNSSPILSSKQQYPQTLNRMYLELRHNVMRTCQHSTTIPLLLDTSTSVYHEIECVFVCHFSCWWEHRMSR